MRDLEWSIIQNSGCTAICSRQLRSRRPHCLAGMLFFGLIILVLVVMQVSCAGKDPQHVTLALKVLGNFDFDGADIPFPNACSQKLPGHALSNVARSSVMPYLEDDRVEVRLAAVSTCCDLFMCDPICSHTSDHATSLISIMLNKLLAIGIADPGELWVIFQTCIRTK